MANGADFTLKSEMNDPYQDSEYDIDCVQNGGHISVQSPNVKYLDAVSQIGDLPERLADEVNGIGTTGAMRYILQTEYGFSDEEITEQNDVSKGTVRSQIKSVRSKAVLSPPAMREIGEFRASRAGLEDPELGVGFEEQAFVATERGDVNLHMTYEPSTPRSSSSWSFRGEATLQDEDVQFIIDVEFKISTAHGVMLKHTKPAIRKDTWNRPKAYLRFGSYDVYPLPHTEVSTNPNGSVFSGAAQQLATDVDQIFSSASPEESAPRYFEGFDDSHIFTPQHSGPEDTPETLLYRLLSGEGKLHIDEFSDYIIEQRRLEDLLLTYPSVHPERLPSRALEYIFNQPSSDINAAQVFDRYRISVHRIIV